MSVPHHVYNQSSTCQTDFEFMLMLQETAEIRERTAVLNAGYRLVRMIRSYTQGELLLAEVKGQDEDEDKNDYGGQMVMIKSADEMFVYKRIIKEDDFIYTTDRNILQEAANLRRLVHPHIVQYVDLFRVKCTNKKMLATAYVKDAVSMDQFISKHHAKISTGRMNLARYQQLVKKLMKQLISTLQWMHDEQQCCHLDICPSNILVNVHDESITLCDFSLSQSFVTNTTTNNFQCYIHDVTANNASYASPQVMDNNCYYDARCADVWSFTITMFECLTGHKLYDPKHSFEYNHNSACNIKCGYHALYNKQLKNYIMKNYYPMYIDQYAVDVLCRGLQMEEVDRSTAAQIMRCEYFK